MNIEINDEQNTVTIDGKTYWQFKAYDEHKVKNWVKNEANNGELVDLLQLIRDEIRTRWFKE